MQSARYIDFGTTDPVTSQAVYHGLAEAMEPGDDPVLDIVSPDEPYVCIGAHQELHKEVDVEAAREAGYPIYRRHVGGGTVLLDADQVFWHYVLPADEYANRSTDDLFRTFLQPAIDTYREFGIEATYKPVNDILADKKKIGGTGAGRIGDAVMLVGSFMYDFDIDGMVEISRTPTPEFEEQLRSGLETNMTTISDQLADPPDREELLSTFRTEIEDTLDWSLATDKPTEPEREAIETVKSELEDEEWLDRTNLASGRSRTKIREETHLSEGRHKATGGMIKATVLDQNGVVGDLLLSGDIQVLPEDGLHQLAVDLTGRPVEQDSLADAAKQSIERRELELPGVTPEDIATAIMAAVEDD